MFLNGLLLISFYFFIFILPTVGIVLGIIGLKNIISNKNNLSKKRNNRFCIYGIISLLFFIFILFFPINTVLTLKYSKPESLLNYFEKTLNTLKRKVLEIRYIPKKSYIVVLEKKELQMRNMMDA